MQKFGVIGEIKTKLSAVWTSPPAMRSNNHLKFSIHCGAMHLNGWPVFYRLCKMTCHNDCAWPSVFITSWIPILRSFLHAWLSHNYHLRRARGERNEMVVFAPQVTHARLPFLITWLGEARGDQPMENFENTGWCVKQHMGFPELLQECFQITGNIYEWNFFILLMMFILSVSGMLVSSKSTP